MTVLLRTLYVLALIVLVMLGFKDLDESGAPELVTALGPVAMFLGACVWVMWSEDQRQEQQRERERENRASSTYQ